MPYTTTPPGTVTFGSPTNSTPGVLNPGARTNVAPASVAPAALSSSIPGHSDPAVPTGAAPAASAARVLATSDAGVGTVDLAQPLLPQPMSAQFTPAFTELTGSNQALNSLRVSPADVGKFLQGKANNALVTYEVVAGTDAEALPGIVRPANFHAANNPFVFAQRA